MSTTFNKRQLRGISSLFSRRVFNGLLKDDMSLLKQIIAHYYLEDICNAPLTKIFKTSYSCLLKGYRCEYVYKNELINQKLIGEYGTEKTLAINEFKVGNSIADLAMFNGESKAFEIKSDLDTPFRLPSQMFDYTRLFQKCYIVVPEERFNNYIYEIESGIGVIVMTRVKRHFELVQAKDATPNKSIDSDLVMRCLHTKEYKHLIQTYYDVLPNVSAFEMFAACSELMKSIPNRDLQKLFLREIESRKNTTQRLCNVQKELRQICLSMNMTDRGIKQLNKRLSTTLN